MPQPRARTRTSFVADPSEERPRTLHEEDNPRHRLRVEHNRDVLLVHLSGEDGAGWTVMAVDRATRRVAVAQARRQIDATEQAYRELKGARPLETRRAGSGSPLGLRRVQPFDEVALEGDVREDLVEPAWEPPGVVAEEHDHGRGR